MFASPTRVNTFSLLSAQFTQSFVAVNWARQFYVCERRIRTLLWHGCVRAKIGSLLGLVHYHASCRVLKIPSTISPLFNDIKSIFKCRIEPRDFLSPLSSPSLLLRSPKASANARVHEESAENSRISSGVSFGREKAVKDNARVCFFKAGKIEISGQLAAALTFSFPFYSQVE